MYEDRQILFDQPARDISQYSLAWLRKIEHANRYENAQCSRYLPKALGH